MTLKHLKVFVAVCEHGGITKAAKALHVVQPAVSTAVSELEKYYNATLFNRINQRLVLTELGKELLVKAKGILSEFENFEQTASLGGQNPKLCIGSSLTLGKTLLPQFLTTLKAELPSLKTTFIIDTSSAIEKKLEYGELDFGIVEGEIFAEHLVKSPVGEDRLIAVCAPFYSITPSITLSELIRHPLLLRERGSASRELFERSLTANQLTASPFVESISNEALVAFAKQGHGIAVLPEGIVSDAISQKELSALTITDSSLVRTHYIITRKNKCFNQISQNAIELLKNLAGAADNVKFAAEAYSKEDLLSTVPACHQPALPDECKKNN